MGKKKKKGQKKKKDALAKLPKNVAGQAREIWLAGLGALDRARKDGGEQFDDLVKRGEQVRSKGSEAIDDVLDQIEQAGRAATGKAKSATKKAAGLAGAGVDTLESAVEAIMVRTGIPGGEEVAALSDQVEALRARMAHLLGDGPAPTVYSLQPREDGWAVQKVGAKQASSTHGTKKEALVAARKLAKQHAPSRLVIHRADGTEQETVEYEA